MELKPIGVIHSPFTQPTGTPIQPPFADGAEGRVVVDEQYAEALKDLAGFERIWLVYWFDRAPPARLTVVPFLDETPRGLFAVRAPCRPNPIGLSAVRLLGIEGSVLRVADLDVLDGTPLLDIKPYVPRFDSFPGSRHGWLEGAEHRRGLADDRFAGQE
jgi:tRNA-Thr(GGU) m(6)t(6)A37 methyltransferase TsaA